MKNEGKGRWLMHFLVDITKHILELNVMVNWAHLPINIGINQGIACGLMFRKCMPDLSDYLFKELGVVIEKDSMTHILWAHDLILFSDTTKDLQGCLDDLQTFCSCNEVICAKARKTIFSIQTECHKLIFSEETFTGHHINVTIFCRSTILSYLYFIFYAFLKIISFNNYSASLFSLFLWLAVTILKLFKRHLSIEQVLFRCKGLTLLFFHMC